MATAAWVGGIGAAGCSREATGPKPVPTLASSPQAAAAFEAIRARWGDPDAKPAALRRQLADFIDHFPADALVPLAHVYLALVASQQGDVAFADAQLALGRSLPPGTARDLWTVARARRLRLKNDSEAALALLRPLVGKNVDPVNRAIFEKELTLAALATHRDYEAISYMDAWVRAGSEEERGRTLAAVKALVERLSPDVLIGALEVMRTRREGLGYGVEIERILAARLAEVAIQGADAELARMLLDPDAGALVVGGEAGAALSELATSRRGLNLVEGRTLGLLLPTESPALRDESADVLRGVMWALGLPRGLRGARGAQTAPATTIRACAAAQPAPALDEPRPDEMLRLATRDDAGSADRTEVSLDELAGEGAAVIIAGLDVQTAERALHWGDNHGVPVIALVPPSDNQDPGAFGFVLGEPRENVLNALAKAAPTLASQQVAPIIDASEVPLYPARGGRVGALSLLSPISCDVPQARAGDPRFPVAQWEHAATRAWLVSGSPSCARDVIAELSEARARGVVALALEAAALPPHAAGLRVLTASAGLVPIEAQPSSPEDAGAGDELSRFVATLGAVGWWTALGRDAATLARVSLDELPADTAVSAAAVRERRAHARDVLAAARARLWTTETTSWVEGHKLTRTVCAVEAPDK